MKIDNYKALKKKDWQEVAIKFNIEFEENSVIRYLVEKIAEKIGVDDLIVNDNELKKQVADKINSDLKINDIEKVTKVVTKKVKSEKVKKPKTVLFSKTDSKKVIVEEILEIEEISVAQLPKLLQLRLECESYGISWSEIHTEQNLEQVINGVKSAGVQPIKEMPTSIKKSNENNEVAIIQPNTPFEISSSNASDIAKNIINTPSHNTDFNSITTISNNVFSSGYADSNEYLEIYKNIYVKAILGHWRSLSVAEINEMILRDVQTFKHQVNLNPLQPNKAEIILTVGNNSIRIPSDNSNEWLDING